MGWPAVMAAAPGAPPPGAAAAAAGGGATTSAMAPAAEMFPGMMKAGRVVFLDEIAASPAQFIDASIRTYGKLVHMSAREAMATIEDRSKKHRLRVSTGLFNDFPFKMGAMMQFIGECQRDSLSALPPHEDSSATVTTTSGGGRVVSLASLPAPSAAKRSPASATVAPPAPPLAAAAGVGSDAAGAALEVKGIVKPEDSVMAPELVVSMASLVLVARVHRNVDGMDEKLYRQSIEMRRRFEVQHGLVPRAPSHTAADSAHAS